MINIQLLIKKKHIMQNFEELFPNLVIFRMLIPQTTWRTDPSGEP